MAISPSEFSTTRAASAASVASASLVDANRFGRESGRPLAGGEAFAMGIPSTRLGLDPLALFLCEPRIHGLDVHRTLE